MSDCWNMESSRAIYPWHIYDTLWYLSGIGFWSSAADSFSWSCLFRSGSLFVQFNKLNYNNRSIESLWLVPRCPNDPNFYPGECLNQFMIHQHKSIHLYQETKRGHHQSSTYFYHLFNCWNNNNAFKIQEQQTCQLNQYLLHQQQSTG